MTEISLDIHLISFTLITMKHVTNETKAYMESLLNTSKFLNMLFTK
jgi:hypothetical protein